MLETVGILIIFFMEMCDYTGILMPIIASLTTFFLINNLFYWARINFTTAMYSYIVWQAVSGSITFMLLCCILIFAFSSAFLVLNNTQAQMSRVSNP